MQEYDLALMSLVIFLPALFGVVLLLFPRKWIEPMKWWALLGAALTLSLSLCMLIDFYSMLDSKLDAAGRPLHSPEGSLEWRVLEAQTAAALDVPGPRLAKDWVARSRWIDRFNIDYAIGIDGISMPLILLTTLVLVLAVIASWNVMENVKLYLFLMLLMESGVLGSFMALDMFLFFFFFEVTLIPMYFLIGFWGGGRRKYAAMKYLLYTMLGSLLILVAMFNLYLTNVRDFVDQNVVALKVEEMRRNDPTLTIEDAKGRVIINTFDIVTLQRAGRAAMAVLRGEGDKLAAWVPLAEQRKDPTKQYVLGRGADPQSTRSRMDQAFFTSGWQYGLFLLIFVGFAVKLPLVPLHSWLPDAHVEAPTAVSMVLAGVLLKLGGYGMMRFAFPICPWAAHELAWWLGLAGVIAIVYGALVAMGQTDFKKMLAYSSVSHMGYVMLGIAAWSTVKPWALAMNGAMFQMVAHGISSAGLFFVVGVLYDRAHHRDMNRFGGVWGMMPRYGSLAAVLFFASMGLPGLCGFIGEIFVMLGSWPFCWGLSLAAMLTTVLTAGYLLWTWQRVFTGPKKFEENYPDVTVREVIVLLTLVLLAIALGVLPSLVLSWSEPGVTNLVETLTR